MTREMIEHIYLDAAMGRSAIDADDLKVLASIALASLTQADDGWRDIKDAPRDGTRVLLYAKEFSVAHFKKNGRTGEQWWETDEGTCYLSPTHWRPLPPAPKPQGGTE